MKIGYARVSRKTQDLTQQIEQLKKAGCEKIFSEVVTGARNKSPEFDRTMENLRPGDTLVVCALDRLGRSMMHLISTANALKHQGVLLISLRENIDTNSTGGKILFYFFSLMAEIELEFIRERTRLSLERTGTSGKRPRSGRKKGMARATIERRRKAFEIYNTGQYSAKEISEIFKKPVKTIYNWIHWWRKYGSKIYYDNGNAKPLEQSKTIHES